MLELLNERGPAGVTTTEIARRVGLSQGAVFRHFADKRAMWAAAFDMIEAHIKPRMAAIAASDAPPLDRILRAMERWLEACREIPAMTALLFYRAPDSEGAALRQIVAERNDRLRGLIRHLLQEARDAGAIDAHIDLDAAAALCLGIVQTTLLRRHLLTPKEPPETPEAMFALLLKALRAHE